MTRCSKHGVAEGDREHGDQQEQAMDGPQESHDGMLVPRFADWKPGIRTCVVTESSGETLSPSRAISGTGTGGRKFGLQSPDGWRFIETPTTGEYPCSV